SAGGAADSGCGTVPDASATAGGSAAEPASTADGAGSDCASGLEVGTGGGGTASTADSTTTMGGGGGGGTTAVSANGATASATISSGGGGGAGCATGAAPISPISSSKAWRKLVAVWYRLSGSFARALSTTVSRSFGSPGRKVLGGAG